MQFNENLIKNQESRSQIENDEIQGSENSNVMYLEKGKTSNSSALFTLMPKVLPDEEMAKGTNYLNSKQREFVNVIHTWVKDYIKYDRHNIEPIHIFLLGSLGTGALRNRL